MMMKKKTTTTMMMISLIVIYLIGNCLCSTYVRVLAGVVFSTVEDDHLEYQMSEGLNAKWITILYKT